MENSKKNSHYRHEKDQMNIPEVYILRWGHRIQRDVRLTTHVILTARALGAKGFFLTDVTDEKIKNTINKISENWGGNFSFEMGKNWKKIVKEWKKEGGIVVHLTVYGENIQTSKVLDEIKNKKRKILVIVGSQKVPNQFYTEEISDFNLAVGNQPHSECAALAIFLDRYFMGKPLGKNFENAKKKIIPMRRGKKIDCNNDMG